jgi:alpha-ketoglutarate-dependent dioxygenase alkB family protein 2
MSKIIKSDQDKIHIVYHKNFIHKDDVKKIFDILEKNMIYNTEEQSQVFMFDKYVSIPRKQVAYSEPGLKYSFSGNKVDAKDWTVDDPVCNIIRQMRDHLELKTKVKFNFCLVNRYKDGDDYIGPHSDSEYDLEHKCIAGISLGGERNMVFDAKGEVKCVEKKIKLLLETGSMFVMLDETNKNWKHSVPKSKKVVGVRISLTFRNMKVNNNVK